MPVNYVECAQPGATSELLLVEGLSALSAVKQVRNRKSQSVLAMQGKVPNASRHSLEKILSNEHCRELARRLGCGESSACDPDKLRFRKVCILSESDPDGEHAKRLLCTLFQIVFGALVDQDRIRTVSAPLCRIQNQSATGSADQPLHNREYLWSEEERRRYLNDANIENTATLTQFKGLASLASDELLELVVDPATRRERLVSPLT